MFHVKLHKGAAMTEESPEVRRCAADPSVETALRCGRCETPICPKCLVMTPVGARCRRCAPTRKNPIYVVSPLGYVKAIGAGLGTATIGGLVASVIPFFG